MKHRSLFLPAIFVGRALSIGENLPRLTAEDIQRITTPALKKGLIPIKNPLWCVLQAQLDAMQNMSLVRRVSPANR